MCDCEIPVPAIVREFDAVFRRDTNLSYRHAGGIDQDSSDVHPVTYGQTSSIPESFPEREVLVSEIGDEESAPSHDEGRRRRWISRDLTEESPIWRFTTRSL